MKYIKSILYFTGCLAALVLLAACEKEDLARAGTSFVEGEEYPLILSSATIGGPSTRTVDGKWTGTETLHVQVISEYSTTTHPNQVDWSGATKLTYSVDPGTGKMTIIDGTEPLWMSADEKKLVRAWYGYDNYQAGETTLTACPGDFKVKENQQGFDPMYSDFIYAQKVLTFDTDKDGAILDFYHQVARVTVNIRESPTGQYNITNPYEAVKILNVHNEGTLSAPGYNDSTSEFDNYGTWVAKGTTTEMTMNWLNIGGPGVGNPIGTDEKAIASYTAVVIPQTIAEGTNLFSLAVEGISSLAYYKVPTGGIEWKPGCDYTYNITVDVPTLSLTLGNVNWEYSSTGSGDVTVTTP